MKGNFWQWLSIREICTPDIVVPNLCERAKDSLLYSSHIANFVSLQYNSWFSFPNSITARRFSPLVLVLHTSCKVRSCDLSLTLMRTKIFEDRIVCQLQMDGYMEFIRTLGKFPLLHVTNWTSENHFLSIFFLFKILQWNHLHEQYL